MGMVTQMSVELNSHILLEKYMHVHLFYLFFLIACNQWVWLTGNSVFCLLHSGRASPFLQDKK